MINFSKYQPAIEIRNYIDSYFTISTGIYNKKESPDGFPNSLNNHPQGTIDLMFVLKGNGIKVSTVNQHGLALSKIFLMAQQERVFEISFMPDTFIFGVVFHVESFNKFFNLPLSELTNSGAIILDILDTPYIEFYDALKTQCSPQKITQLANQFLFKQLSKVDFEFSKFDLLIRSIRNTSGEASIDDLSSNANMSKRSLQRKMKEVTGVGAKSYSNTMRFRKAMRLIVNESNYDWQSILFECNYYDQAHFIKEFKKYTGFTPSGFLKEQITLSEFFEGNKKDFD